MTLIARMMLCSGRLSAENALLAIPPSFGFEVSASIFKAIILTG